MNLTEKTPQQSPDYNSTVLTSQRCRPESPSSYFMCFVNSATLQHYRVKYQPSYHIGPFSNQQLEIPGSIFQRRIINSLPFCGKQLRNHPVNFLGTFGRRGSGLAPQHKVFRAKPDRGSPLKLPCPLPHTNANACKAENTQDSWCLRLLRLQLRAPAKTEKGGPGVTVLKSRSGCQDLEGRRWPRYSSLSAASLGAHSQEAGTGSGRPWNPGTPMGLSQVAS